MTGKPENPPAWLRIPETPTGIADLVLEELREKIRASLNERTKPNV